jgi:hypothetical protein
MTLISTDWRLLLGMVYLMKNAPVEEEAVARSKVACCPTAIRRAAALASEGAKHAVEGRSWQTSSAAGGSPSPARTHSSTSSTMPDSVWTHDTVRVRLLHGVMGS